MILLISENTKARS